MPHATTPSPTRMRVWGFRDLKELDAISIEVVLRARNAMSYCQRDMLMVFNNVVQLRTGGGTAWLVS